MGNGQLKSATAAGKPLRSDIAPNDSALSAKSEMRPGVNPDLKPTLTKSAKSVTISLAETFKGMQPPDPSIKAKFIKQAAGGVNGWLTEAQLLKEPELAVHPLNRRIIELFDEGRRGPKGEAYDLTRYVKILMMFDGQRSAKYLMECTFATYDIDQDNRISAEDMFYILKMALEEQLSDDMLWIMVDNLMTKAALTSSQGISQFDFATLVNSAHGLPKLIF